MTLEMVGKAWCSRASRLCQRRDVLAWFNAQGEEFQRLINTALRAYKNAHEKA